MEFLALIHGSENGWNELSDDERQAVYQRYMEFSERPEVVGGAELQETTAATTVRVRNGDSMVTDGPVRRGQGGARRLLHPRGRIDRRRLQAGRRDPGRRARRDRNSARLRSRGELRCATRC